MSTIVVQMGHVPRTRGATGTRDEQRFNREVAPRLSARLSNMGHRVHVIGADDRVPPSDVFVALHTDGSANRDRRGASVGFPNADGARLAELWKDEHTKIGYPGGFLPNNYTAALRGYYGFGRSSARYKFLAEHGTTTNDHDHAWLFGHLDQCADAHARAIQRLLGGGVIDEPSAPAIIIDLGDEERFMARRKRAVFSVPTDNDGHAWTMLDGSYGSPKVRYAEFISVAPLGPYPKENGYWPLPVIGHQERGGGTCITLDKAPANRKVGVVVDYVD